MKCVGGKKLPHIIHIKLLSNGDGLPIPSQATPESSGFDLHAAINEQVTIMPGKRHLIPTGIAIAMSKQLEAQVRPRSGLAWKFGITVLNTPGTIDADYRGEIKVILVNHGDEPFIINRGDRIAQLVFQEVPTVQLEIVTSLSESSRGEGGFGHTGK